MREAFSAQNLVDIKYPAWAFGYQSSRTLIGADLNPDCQVYLSLIAPRRHNITDAIAIPRVHGSTKDHCDQLDKLVHNKEKSKKIFFKHRYW